MHETAPVSRRVILPQRCVLAFALATTESGYTQSKEDTAREYVRLGYPVWQRYEKEVLRSINKIVPHLKTWGVHIANDVGSAALSALFASGAYDVIVLFTHYNRSLGKLELWDGMTGIDQVLHIIPPDFNGIIDLTACETHDTLVMPIRKHSPQCLVRHSTLPVTPDIWLYFILAMFSIIREGNMSYIDAQIKAREAMLK